MLVYLDVEYFYWCDHAVSVMIINVNGNESLWWDDDSVGIIEIGAATLWYKMMTWEYMKIKDVIVTLYWLHNKTNVIVHHINFQNYVID
jgi:hypothetical protein